MSLARELWQASLEAADACLAHPFVRGIADGTLERERYRDFVAQDAAFLEAFARAYAHCLARSPEREGLYAFRELLDGVFRELELHRIASRELGIDLDHVRPAPATVSYTDFLADAVASGAGVGETLAAMTPCMRLYAYLGARMAAETGAGARLPAAYRDWIATYAGEDFQALAALIESLLDRYATGSEREREHYRRAMELERAFFDSAWAGAASGAGSGQLAVTRRKGAIT
jgi:thiaminase/transcriptional activator TenA